MRTPILFAENFFNRVLFPGHDITASGAATGREAWRVGTGRRGQTNSWRAAAAGDGWVQVDCAAVRSADMLVIDRDHNLAGKHIELTADGATVLDLTIASAVSVGGDVDGAAGVVTQEGAWLIRFPSTAGQVWRLTVDAGVATSFVPEIRGIYLGSSWQLSEYLDLPYSDSERELIYQATTTSAGWVGRSSLAQRRDGTLLIKLMSSDEISTAEYYVEELFGAGRPMWIVFDPQRAERAVLAIKLPGRVGLRREEGWFLPQAALDWTEHEPRLR